MSRAVLALAALALAGCAAAEDPLAVTEQPSQGGCSALGEQKTAVVVVAASNTTSNVSLADVRKAFFDTSIRSVASYLDEASYGRAWLSGDVFGPYTLTQNVWCADMAGVRDAAIAAADADVDFTRYNRVVVLFTMNGCTDAYGYPPRCEQLASNDGAFSASSVEISASWVNGHTPEEIARVAAHELGHNFGLAHANMRTFTKLFPEAIGANGALGTLTESGDHFSMMGDTAAPLAHLAAPQKARIGWIDSSEVAVVEQGGTYTLDPLETAPSTLKIRRGSCGSSWLWAEWRDDVGFDDVLTSVHEGALIHFEDGATIPDTEGGYPSHLVDMTPGDSNWDNPALAAGRSWSDPYSNLTLDARMGTSGLELDVRYGAVTPLAATAHISRATLDRSFYQQMRAVVLAASTQDASCPVAAAGAIVTFRVRQPDGVVVSTNATADGDGVADGNFSPTQVGTHLLEVTASDGVRSVTSAPVSFEVIDTSAPSLSVTSPAQGATTGSSGAILIDANEPIDPATATCVLDGAGCVCSPLSLTRLSCRFVGLAHGAHAVSVTVADPSGNRGSAESQWIVDAIAPAIVFVTPSPTAGSTVRAGVGVAFTVTEAATTTCTLDGVAFTCAAGTPTAFTLATGAHTVAVLAIDPVGNTGARSLAFTVDATPPIMTLTKAPAPFVNPWRQGNKLSFGFSASETLGWLECRYDDRRDACGPTTYDSYGGWWYLDFAEKLHTFTVRGSDLVGNTSPVASVSFTVDTTDPTLTLQSGPPCDLTLSTVTVRFTASDKNLARVECALDGQGWRACDTTTYETVSVGYGAHELAVRSVDKADNVSPVQTWSWFRGIDPACDE